MRLLHRLLYLERISVHNQLSTLRQAQNFPTLLEDMGKRQEIQYTIVLANGHTLIIGLHRSMILATRQDNTL